MDGLVGSRRREQALALTLWLVCIPLAALLIAIVLLVEAGAIVGRDAIYPRAVLIALLAVAAVALVRELLAARRRERNGDGDVGDDGDAEGARGRHIAWTRVAAAGAALAAMPLLLPTAGYLVSTAVLSAVVALALGVRSWLAAVALVASVSIASYLLFVVVLGARVPPGMILP